MTETTNRRGSLRPIGAELARIAGPVLGKRGLGEAQLLAQWASIVGAEFADETLPVKLSFSREQSIKGERRNGTLRLLVSSSAALSIQHREPQILDRINGFFGYNAVARLALVQGPLPSRPETGPLGPRPLSSAETAELDAKLADMPESGLRTALQRLGAAVLGSRRP
jgi:hypothetical protein